MKLGPLTAVAAAAALLFLGSCGGGSSNPEEPSSYFSSMRELAIEIAYEPGAEPYVGTTAGGLDYWRITEDNLAALFAARDPAVSLTVPNELAEMKALATQNQTTWTTGEIEALAKAARTTTSTAEKAVFVVLFLNGYLDDDGSPNQQVIGVSLTGTTIIAMFKDVIRSTSVVGGTVVPKYVEQSTLVHEMGHGLGLVNNGIPLTTAHHDAEHGAHCSNEDCVMNWVNEGANDAIPFVQKFITSGETVMFQNECLSDARAYAP